MKMFGGCMVLFKVVSCSLTHDEERVPLTNRLAVYEPGETRAGVSSAVRLQ